MTQFSETKVRITFASNLKDLMEKHSLNECKLSEKIDISQSALNRLKNGKVTPNFFQLLILSEFFSVSVEYFSMNLYNFNDFSPVIDVKSIYKDNKKIVGFVKKDNDLKTNKNNLLLNIGNNQSKQSLLPLNSAILINTTNTIPKSNHISVILQESELILSKKTGSSLTKLDDLNQRIDYEKDIILGTLIKVYYNVIYSNNMIKNSNI